MTTAVLYSWRLLKHRRLSTALIVIAVSLGFAVATVGLVAANSTLNNPRVLLETSMAPTVDAVVSYHGGQPLVQDLSGTTIERDRTVAPSTEFSSASQMTDTIRDVLPDATVVEASTQTGSIVTSDLAVDGVPLQVVASSDTEGWILPGSLSGDAPEGTSVVISRDLADRSGLSLGAPLELVLTDVRLDVVVGGIVERTQGDSVVASADLIPADALPSFVDSPFAYSWFVVGDGLRWDDVVVLNGAGMSVLSRNVVVNNLATQPMLPTISSPLAEIATPLGGAVTALVIAAVLILPVLMLTDQRDSRSRALLRSVGAPQGVLHRMAAVRGVFVTIGALILGVCAGAVALWVMRLLPHFGPLHPQIPWSALGTMAVVGVVAGAGAGFVSSRPWVRRDAMTALRMEASDARAVKAPSRWRLAPSVVGLVALMAGAASGLLPLSLLGGLLVTVGVAMAMRNILGGLGHLAGRVGMSARYGIREVSRHPARSSPAIAVIAAAGVFVTAVSMVASTAAATDRAAYEPRLAEGALEINLTPEPSVGIDSYQAAVAELGSRLSQEYVMERVDVVHGLGFVSDGELVPDPAVFVEADGYQMNHYVSQIRVADSADELGVRLDDAATVTTALAAGKMVAIGIPDLTSGTLTLSVEGGAPLAVEVQAFAHETNEAWFAIPPAIVTQLNGTSIPVLQVATRSSETLSQSDEDQIRLMAVQTMAGTAHTSVYVERGFQPNPEVQALTVASMAAAAIAGLIAVLLSSLSVAETVRTLATLHQVGAARRTLSAVSAWVTSSAAVVGSAVGIILGVFVGAMLIFNSDAVRVFSWSLQTGAALHPAVSPVVLAMVGLGGVVLAMGAGIAMTPYLVSRAKRVTQASKH